MCPLSSSRGPRSHCGVVGGGLQTASWGEPGGGPEGVNPDRAGGPSSLEQRGMNSNPLHFNSVKNNKYINIYIHTHTHTHIYIRKECGGIQAAAGRELPRGPSPAGIRGQRAAGLPPQNRARSKATAPLASLCCFSPSL